MTAVLLKDSVGWGFVLWLIGYVLGIALFFVVPPGQIGWVIMPIGVLLTAWILTRVRSDRLSHYLVIAITWTAIAVLLDYFLIVRAFHPPDGYYKADVYLYYTLMFVMPLAAGWWKTISVRSTRAA